MKKISFMIPILSAAILSGCGAGNGQQDSGKLQVYTSFYAMYDFARMIGGDMAEIHNICPVGSEPHDFEPTAQDMAGLSKADVFIYNGLGMEHWADSAAETLGDDTIIVEASSAVPNITENSDPHVWLDPENAIAELEAIADSFSRADPDNAQYYMENLGDYRDKAKELDWKFENASENFSSREIITSHDAYSTLCSAYDLVQIPINGVDNEEEPTPARMAEVETHIKENNIKYIFTEPLSTSKIIDTISADTGCGVLTLDPFEGNLDNKDYFTVMNENLEALKQALN